MYHVKDHNTSSSSSLPALTDNSDFVTAAASTAARRLPLLSFKFHQQQKKNYKTEQYSNIGGIIIFKVGVTTETTSLRETKPTKQTNTSSFMMNWNAADTLLSLCLRC